MHPALLQPQTRDELRRVKQFAKVMKIKIIAVKETPAGKKKRAFLEGPDRSAPVHLLDELQHTIRNHV